MKKSYLIGYNLTKTGQDYSTLIAKIKEIATGWWHCLDSIFIIRTDQNAVQIRDILKEYIDSNDELLVVKLSGDAAWTGFNATCSGWLKNHL
jgi:hypothetical protein